MTRSWTPLAVGYLVLAIAGLLGTAAANALAVVQMRDLAQDWFGSGPAVSSLTIDLLGVAVAGSVLIVVESRRIGLRYGWVLVPLAGVTAIAFVLPLFLALRERRLATNERAARNDADAVNPVP